VTTLLLSFDYHLRVHERFYTSRLMTNNYSTKLERSIALYVLYIHASLNGKIEFVSSREASVATTPKITNVNEISKYVFRTITRSHVIRQ